MTTYNQPTLKHDAQGNLVQQSGVDSTFRGEYSSSNLIYKGLARPGALEGSLVWQIAQLAYSGTNLISIKWPQGSNGAASSEYIFSWTARATYTYS